MVAKMSSDFWCLDDGAAQPPQTLLVGGAAIFGCKYRTRSAVPK
jgi:hypothetical protein